MAATLMPSKLPHDDVALSHQEHLDRVRTNQYVPGKHGEEFERAYLAPEIAVQGALRKTFGNPTPMLVTVLLTAN
jgi:hypothetical protein